MLPQQAISYGSAACVHPSAASAASVGRNSAVRYVASPMEIQQQQHLAQFPAIGSHSSCCSSAVSPAVAAATAADANWLSQQLSDMQRLRQSMMDGMCRIQQPSTSLPPQLLQVQPATSVDEMTSAAPNDCENRNVNAVYSTTALYDVSPPRATEQSRHSRANARRRRLPNSRRDSHHHPAQCRRQTSPYMSSEDESFSTASVSSHTEDEEEAERVSRHLKQQHQSRITDDERTGLIAYYAANNDTDEKTAGQATTTHVVAHPAPAEIEAMYTNFLTVSRKLSSLIADYYAASTVGGQQSQQATQRNDPQQQQLSAEPLYHLPQHERQHGPSKRPSLILPSPLRRSLESRRIDQQSQQLPQPPPPVPPHRQPQSSQVDVALKLKQQQQQQQPQAQAQQQQQQEQSPENAKEVQRTSRKGDRNKHLRHQQQQQQQQQLQDLGAKDDRAAAAGKPPGIGHRIRASLGRLSPRLRSRPPPLPPLPQTPSNSQTSRTPTPTQQPQTSKLPHVDMPQTAAATTQPPADSIVGSHNNTPAATTVLLDTRVRLVPEGQSLDPCLQKLQRLRSTVLGLVQRSVDPVLQSLRDIQGRQHGDVAEGGSQREAAASTANMGEVLVSLQDVMSLMELLSRSVMLVSMHNLDPNSLKLVYLSSSYIRSLKRLSKTLANSGGAGSTEPGSDQTQDEGLKM